MRWSLFGSLLVGGRDVWKGTGKAGREPTRETRGGRSGGRRVEAEFVEPRENDKGRARLKPKISHAFRCELAFNRTTKQNLAGREGARCK